jgi:hypothetical protein
MKATRWLAVVVVLALALALIKAVFGDSPVWIVLFMLVVFFVFEYARGGGRWLRSLAGALTAAAVYILYSGLMPADTAGKQAGLVILTLAVAAPFVFRIIGDRRGTTNPH